jgi:hypothetical protein
MKTEDSTHCLCVNFNHLMRTLKIICVNFNHRRAVTPFLLQPVLR